MSFLTVIDHILWFIHHWRFRIELHLFRIFLQYLNGSLG